MLRNFRERCLAVLAMSVCRWPWAFLLVGVALTGAAGFYAYSYLELRPSRNDLIGKRDEYHRLQLAYEQEFVGEDDYIVLVESDQPQRNRQVVNALVAVLPSPQNNPHPSDAPDAQRFSRADMFYQVNLDILRSRFLYFLSTDELLDVRNGIKESKQLLQYLQNSPKLETFLWLMNHLVRRLGGAEAAESARWQTTTAGATAVR